MTTWFLSSICNLSNTITYKFLILLPIWNTHSSQICLDAGIMYRHLHMKLLGRYSPNLHFIYFHGIPPFYSLLSNSVIVQNGHNKDSGVSYSWVLTYSVLCTDTPVWTSAFYKQISPWSKLSTLISIQTNLVRQGEFKRPL